MMTAAYCFNSSVCSRGKVNRDSLLVTIPQGINSLSETNSHAAIEKTCPRIQSPGNS